MALASPPRDPWEDDSDADFASAASFELDACSDAGEDSGDHRDARLPSPPASPGALVDADACDDARRAEDAMMERAGRSAGTDGDDPWTYTRSVVGTPSGSARELTGPSRRLKLGTPPRFFKQQRKAPAGTPRVATSERVPRARVSLAEMPVPGAPIRVFDDNT